MNAIMRNHTGKVKNRNHSVLRRRVVTTLLLLLCIVFIFHNSLEGAEVSGDRSFQLTQTMNGWLFDRFHLFLMERFIRKMAHFLEYALEGGLAVSVIWAYERKVCQYASQAALLGVLTALIDETLQLFSDGRAALVGDIWIDFGGFLSGFLFGVLCLWIGRKFSGRFMEPRG